jgi:hypothetical protein
VTDKLSPQDEDIIRRLRSFENAGSDYPADVLEKRRASFHNAARGLVVAVPAAGFVKGLMHYLLHTTEAALKVILVCELLAATGLGAYLYRDQIKNWLAFETGRPTVTLSSRTPLPTMTSAATLTTTPTAPATPTPIPTAPATPTPTRTATATIFSAEPTQTPRPTNPGNHYGQTQTPRP